MTTQNKDHLVSWRLIATACNKNKRHRIRGSSCHIISRGRPRDPNRYVIATTLRTTARPTLLDDSARHRCSMPSLQSQISFLHFRCTDSSRQQRKRKNRPANTPSRKSAQQQQQKLYTKSGHLATHVVGNQPVSGRALFAADRPSAGDGRDGSSPQRARHRRALLPPQRRPLPGALKLGLA